MTRDGERTRQKEQEGPESGKSLVSMKNWKAALDRDYAKRDMRSVRKSGQGPLECSTTGRRVLGGHWRASGKDLFIETWSDLFIETVTLAAECNIY